MIKPTYDSPEAEAAAHREQAASEWALAHRTEYDAMLLEIFPNDYPRIPGEWRRRMDVLEGTCARRNDSPNEERTAA